jgi:hypothetical protein
MTPATRRSSNGDSVVRPSVWLSARPLGHSSSPRLLAILFALMLVAAALAAPSAFARTSRPYQSSFNVLPGGAIPFVGGPSELAVDQSSGDVYIATGEEGTPAKFVVSRYTAAGAPHNFSAGPDAGSNTLTGFSDNPSRSIAVDSSGGPLDGDVYVTSSGASIEVFASSGESLGTIVAAGEVSGIAVDQSTGALYVTGQGPHSEYRVSRFLPLSPSGSIDSSDYSVSGITLSGATPSRLAVAAGNVYVLETSEGRTFLSKYDASSFAPGFPVAPNPSTIDTGSLAVGPSDVDVDPTTGEVYVNERHQIAVFDSGGLPLYTFGGPGYFGNVSPAVAVKAAASGPAASVYVADNQAGSRAVDVFGTPNKVEALTHPEIASFGPDGTSASSFPGLLSIVIDKNARRLYAVDGGALGIYGFDVSTPPVFPAIGGFAPLSAPGAERSSLAIDNTALGSAGNIYLASRTTNLLYGWSSAGAALGAPFPLDPAVSPGPPNGSPKDLCGAAVDPAGDVWVANYQTSRILHYSSAGASLPGAIDTSAQGRPCKLAFDTNGDAYVTIDDSATHQYASGVWKYTAASGYTSATRIIPLARPDGEPLIALDSSTHHLYVSQRGTCQATGECNLQGWVAEYDSDGTLLDQFSYADERFSAIAVDPTSHATYLATGSGSSGKIRVLGPGVLLPEATARPASGATNTTATLNGLVNTQGVSLSDCHFDYVSEAAFRLSGFSDLSSGGSAPCSPDAGSIPLDLDEHSVSALATGLSESTAYRFRLSATNTNGSGTEAGAFSTAGRPVVETTGSPVRTTTTALLNARVLPSGAPSEYHFEYGDQGPCDANPCEVTETHAAGSGDEVRFVSQRVEGLQPNTTYHYRVIASNGNLAGPATGEDMTVTTRSSDAPLSHGRFPGPPGSDRAYEQVSLPDTGGNPVNLAAAVSDDGSRAFYKVSGGTPISNSGTLINLLYAERTPSGWRSEDIGPPRNQLVGGGWSEPFGNRDLSDQVVMNNSTTGAGKALWHLRPGQPAAKVFAVTSSGDFSGIVSEDASRVLVTMTGSQDPAHPVPPGLLNLYDVSSGSPQLVSLLPDGSVSSCNIEIGNASDIAPSARRLLSPDGSLSFFESCGTLYMRNLPAEQTKLIGPGGSLLKSVPGAAFFTSTQSLTTGDLGGRDIYRYDIGTEALKCVTCIIPGLNANVEPIQGAVVSADGSRAYFKSSTALLPGAATPGIYRVDLASGDLAYVAPGSGARLGENLSAGAMITPDGSAFVFASAAAELNALEGEQNGGSQQLYRYDDRDRSLTCISCPQDGSAPVMPADLGAYLSAEPVGANRTALTADGATLVFVTTNALLPTDQNTARPGQRAGAGTDVYEWRDGRLLMITDGLSAWPPASGPTVSAVTPSGRDIFFTAATQYTQDALDGYPRLYDARIGGGFEFPPPPKPCPLEVCQGTPKGAPEEQAPGTGSFAGPGNAKPAARHKKKKQKHRKSKSQHKKQSRHAKHDRRAAR